MILDHSKITFEKMTRQDIQQVMNWLQVDFVKEWYHDSEPLSYEEEWKSYDDFVDGKDNMFPYIIFYDGKKIGYIQTYNLNLEKEFSELIGLGKDACGVDLFIGEREFLYKGLGSRIIKSFLKNIAFDLTKTDTSIIDPDPANQSAIKAYTKAGYKYLKTIQVPNEKVASYIMVLEKKDLN